MIVCAGTIAVISGGYSDPADRAPVIQEATRVRHHGDQPAAIAGHGTSINEPSTISNYQFTKNRESISIHRDHEYVIGLTINEPSTNHPQPSPAAPSPVTSAAAWHSIGIAAPKFCSTSVGAKKLRLGGMKLREVPPQARMNGRRWLG